MAARCCDSRGRSSDTPSPGQLRGDNLPSQSLQKGCLHIVRPVGGWRFGLVCGTCQSRQPEGRRCTRSSTMGHGRPWKRILRWSGVSVLHALFQATSGRPWQRPRPSGVAAHRGAQRAAAGQRRGDFSPGGSFQQGGQGETGTAWSKGPAQTPCPHSTAFPAWDVGNKDPD